MLPPEMSAKCNPNRCVLTCSNGHQPIPKGIADEMRVS